MRLQLVLTIVLCAIAFTGGVSVVIGSWRWGSAEDVDEAEIAEYNSDVLVWNQTLASEGFPGNFSLTIDNGSLHLPLLPVSPPPLVSGLEFTPYSTLQYAVELRKTFAVNKSSTPRVFLSIASNSMWLKRFSLPYYRTSKKTVLLRLRAVCVQANTGVGCFKGNLTSDYEEVPWSNSVSVAFNVSVVSPLDPMLVALRYDLFSDGSSPVGLEFILVGLGLFVLSLVCLAVLQKRISILWVYGSFALTFHILSLGAGALLEDHWSWQAVYEWTGFCGLLLMIVGAPSALVLSVVFLNGLLTSGLSRAKSFAVSIGASVFCLAICVISLTVLIRPWKSPGVSASSQGPLSAVVGSLVLACHAVLAVALAAASISAALGLDRPASSEISLNALSTEESNLLPGKLKKSRSRCHWNLVISVVFAHWIPVVVFATTVLPPIWNVPVSTYYSFVSENAWNLVASTNLVFKLYLDVVVFYAIFVVLIVALLLRRVLCHSSIVTAPKSVASHALFIGSILLCFAFWLVYWTFWYERIASGNVSGHVSERLARASGHLANLFLSLTAWPVSRNSVFAALAGIPFDKAVVYHRWLGTLFFGSVVAHVACWIWNWIVFDTIGNLIALHQVPHKDNFTVLMIEIVFVVFMVPMAVLSFQYFRRNFHSLFFAWHHAFVVIFLASSIHSWALWLYLAPPLFMYMVDRSVLQYRIALTACMRSARVLSVNRVAGHTSIALTKPFDFIAGQYAFVYFPSVSLLEYHPFSLASNPSDDELLIVAKDMGPESFTQGMANLQAETSCVIDGPHGNPPSIEDLGRFFSSIVFVVGGVGITPVSSFLAALDESKAGSRAFLLWLVREPSLLDVFPSAVRRPSSRVWITCAPPEQENVDVNVQFGRPDLCAAIAGVVAPPALVFACGPIALVREASAIARDLGHHFYAEEFSF